jgi:hypothetical protein
LASVGMKTRAGEDFRFWLQQTEKMCSHPKWLRGYPMFRRCRVSSPYRPRAIILEETVMVRAYGWRSLVVVLMCLRFFVGGGREKSPLACPTMTRCRFPVIPFRPRERRGKPTSTLLRVGGNPRTIRSGQQRRVDGASLLEGVAWLWVLWSSWSMVGKVGS